jgi:hypothetical protein
MNKEFTSPVKQDTVENIKNPVSLVQYGLPSEYSVSLADTYACLSQYKQQSTVILLVHIIIKLLI